MNDSTTTPPKENMESPQEPETKSITTLHHWSIAEKTESETHQSKDVTDKLQKTHEISMHPQAISPKRS